MDRAEIKPGSYVILRSIGKDVLCEVQSVSPSGMVYATHTRDEDNRFSQNKSEVKLFWIQAGDCFRQMGRGYSYEVNEVWQAVDGTIYVGIVELETGDNKGNLKARSLADDSVYEYLPEK